MIERIITHVIRCDGCDASYYDCVDVSPEFIRKAALDEGWQESGDGEAHFCPACAQVKVFT